MALRTMHWLARARCGGADPSMFHPLRGETEANDMAMAICLGCPVQVECLSHALIVNEKSGVWGGATERDRKRLRLACCSRCGRRLRHVEAARSHVAAAAMRCEGCGPAPSQTVAAQAAARRAERAARRVKSRWVAPHLR